MKPKKTPVGECECPLKGCGERVPVYRYAGSGDPKARRFAGRLYAICPTHGRTENNEYLLCHAKLNGPGDPLPADVPPVEASASAPPKPAKSQQQQPPKREPWWHKLRPIIQ